MLQSDVVIALPLHLFVGFDQASGMSMVTAVGDRGVFIVPDRCEVFLAGAVVTQTCGGATTTPVVRYDLRPTAGSDTGRGDGDIAILRLLTTAQGRVIFSRAATGRLLLPGQEVVVELTTQAAGAGAAGFIRPFLLVKMMPEVFANMPAMFPTT